MVPKDNSKKVEPQDLRLLENLKEDLRVLENSWRNESLKPQRVIHHFQEIMDSLSEIPRVEEIEPAGVICSIFKEYLASAANGRTALGDQDWATAVDFIDLLAYSLREGEVPLAGFENIKTRWKEIADGMEFERSADPTEAEIPKAEIPKAETPKEGPRPVSVGAQANNLEENVMSPTTEMPLITDTDAKELLQKAQEALLSGQGESAKELALKAAELIAQSAAEEKRQQELSLRTDLENILNEESEAEHSMTQMNEKIAEREEVLNELTERLSKAQSTLDERETASKQLREDIDKTEAQLAELNQKHKELLDLFQEVLPARDAAERECSKIKAEYGELPVEIESLRDRLQDMERRLEHIRGRKTAVEAELEQVSQAPVV